MEKIYEHIIALRKPIIIVFIAATIFCALCHQLVAVNYNINDYLPDDSASTLAIHKMEEEFAEGIPNARVMIRNVTIPEALEYKAKLAAVDGVEAITWLDDSTDITVPLELIDEDILNTYYKDNNASFNITIHNDTDVIVKAVADIREIIGEDNALAGNAVNISDGVTNTVGEIQLITVVAVLFVFIVLTLSTKSWAEPIIVLIGLGVAVLINSGSNLIFGTISFVTNAAGNVLQLAVSLDYSVFLIHRFEECRRKQKDPKKAMVEALTKSTSSILSSGLTTVIGFLAVILMRFKIGPDVGMALAKGVAISLITTFVFMPAVILATYKWLDKTKHRPLIPEFKLFGKAVSKITLPLVGVFVLLIVPAYLAYTSNSYYYGASHIFNSESRIGRDTEAITEAFGESDTYALLVPSGDSATQKDLSNELHHLPEVTSIISYVDTVGQTIPTSYLDEATLARLDSGNYSRMIISVAVGYEGDEVFELIEKVRDIAHKYYGDDYYLAGNGVSTYDLMDTITADMMKVNVVAIGAVFIVLLFTLKDFILPILLILGIETAIALNLSFPYFTGEPVFYVAYLIISSIQLGATVDYAILLTTRYRENRAKLDRKKALPQTVTDITSSVLVSGSVLAVVGMLMGIVSSNQLLAQLGIFIGRGAILSLIIVLFVMPGILYIFDKLIIKKTKKETA